VKIFLITFFCAVTAIVSAQSNCDNPYVRIKNSEQEFAADTFKLTGDITITLEKRETRSSFVSYEATEATMYFVRGTLPP
jgi:hypothetical protein